MPNTYSNIQLTPADAMEAARYTSLINFFSPTNLFFRLPCSKFSFKDLSTGLFVDKNVSKLYEINEYTHLYNLPNKKTTWTTTAYIINSGYLKIPGLYQQELFLRKKLNNKFAASSLMIVAGTLQSPLVSVFIIADTGIKLYQINKKILQPSDKRATKALKVLQATTFTTLDGLATLPLIALGTLTRPVFIAAQDLSKISLSDSSLSSSTINQTQTQMPATSPTMPEKNNLIHQEGFTYLPSIRQAGITPINSPVMHPLASPDNSENADSLNFIENYYRPKDRLLII